MLYCDKFFMELFGLVEAGFETTGKLTNFIKSNMNQLNRYFMHYV